MKPAAWGSEEMIVQEMVSRKKEKCDSDDVLYLLYSKLKLECKFGKPLSMVQRVEST